MEEQRGLVELGERTRIRNRALWVPLLAATPLADDEARLNSLHQSRVESFLAVTDEVFQVKEYIRDRGVEQSQAEVEQEKLLADEKAETERARIAIRIAAEDYLFAARVYDAQVRGIVMAAREYAAEVEREQLAAEAARVDLGIAKADLHLKEINAKVAMEGIQRAMVQADLARNKLEVAKAGVRVLMAEIASQRAALDVIEAGVQEALAGAEKATLQADVALILAEVVTKQLSKVRLAVETEEIAQGFNFIASKLNDLVNLWNSRTRAEDLRTKGATDIIAEVAKLLAAEEAGQRLGLTEAQNQQAVVSFEVGQTAVEITKERGYQEAVVAAKEAHLTEESSARGQILAKRSWAEDLVNAAYKAVYSTKRVTKYNLLHTHEWIGK